MGYMVDDRSAPAEDRGLPEEAGAGSDATARMPASDAATQRTTPPIWAARAPVPPADAVPLREAVPAEWPPEPGGDLGDETGDQVSDRSVLRSVLLTLVVVVLLGMLGTGLWLIFNRTGGSTPVPSTPPPVSATATSTAETATDTGAATATDTATATESPTPTAVPTAAPTVTRAPAPPPPPVTTSGLVAVPDVVGLSESAAKDALVANGLRFRVFGPRDGTVVSTQPRAGTMVKRGTQVALFVASVTSPATVQAPATG